MIARFLAFAALVSFLGCAAPTSNPNRDDSVARAGVSKKKKEKRCVKEFVVGSRLPLLICEGDPAPHNVAGMDQQEVRDRITRGGSPTRGN